MTNRDFGPFNGLIGTWTGDKGTDMAPEPDGLDNNPYYETITYSTVDDDIDNAETQELTAIHYRQVVRKKKDDTVFHDQTGYLIWEAEKNTVTHTLLIPRGVAVIATGKYNGETDDAGNVIIEVTADSETTPDSIAQSPFMKANATTKSFTHKLTLGDGKMSYWENTVVEIYGKVFDHTDENQLTLLAE